MIQCPKCNATLPDWQKTCQFCNADTQAVARPKGAVVSRSASAFEVPQWVWFAYYGIAGYWVLDGIATIILTFVRVAEATAKAEAATDPIKKMLLQPSMFSYFPVIIGAVSIVFGLGLMAKINWVRGVVNFFSFLKIVVGVCGIVGTLFAGMIFGPWALLYLLLHIFTIATGAGMIYLIGETDKVSY